MVIFGGAGSLGVALHRRDPPHPGKYIKNLKLTKYSHWKFLIWAVVITEQLGLLCRQSYRKVSKQVIMQASKMFVM